MITEKLEIYDGFRCIADKCPMTCCQQWKIAVDDDTYEDWKKVPATEAELGKTVSHKESLSNYVTYKDETRIIRLDEHKKCPFLNTDKLCRLVLKHGDKMLSETCQIFPRQISHFGDRISYALMAGCPAVVDLLEEQQNIQLQIEGEQIDDALMVCRNTLMQLVQNQEYTISEAIQVGFLMLLELLEAEEKEGTFSTEEIRSSTYQKRLLRSIRKMLFQKVYTFEECNELFLDLSENYRKEKIYENYLESLALLAEDYEEESEELIEEDIEAFEQQYQQYEPLLRNYLATEIFANLYLPEYDLEDVVMAMQWIAMEYVSIRHGIFLQWRIRGEKVLTYEMVREAIVIISRMTGYDAEDIQEYLENSFESPIWEWGYLALITGKEEID